MRNRSALPVPLNCRTSAHHFDRADGRPSGAPAARGAQDWAVVLEVDDARSRLPLRRTAAPSRARTSRPLISSSDGRASKRLAASSTLGSTWISPTVLRNTPGSPSTQWATLSMSACSTSGWYHVEVVYSRPRPWRADDRLDRLHRHIALSGTAPSAPRSRRHRPGSASAHSYRAAAPSRSQSVRGCACASLRS